MRRSLAFVGVAAVLLGACQSVPAEFQQAEALECPSGSDCYDEPKPAGPGGTLVVEAGEFFFEIREQNVAEGEIEVTLINEGNAGHDFTIDEAIGDVRSVPPGNDTVPGGDSGEGTLQLFAGEYTFYCSVPGHREQGMEGTLVVEAGGAGAESVTTPTETESP
ncbi:MAG: plastocyanin/azurin family copper-binding protein [Nitriliruptorales bacterium]